MSYDILLYADLGGDELVPVGEDWNYTSNCAPMWRAAGVDLAAFDGRLARVCAAQLEDALVALKADPQRFEAMNPPNRWGDYTSLVKSLTKLWINLRRYPNAIVTVLR